MLLNFDLYILYINCCQTQWQVLNSPRVPCCVRTLCSANLTLPHCCSSICNQLLCLLKSAQPGQPFRNILRALCVSNPRGNATHLCSRQMPTCRSTNRSTCLFTLCIGQCMLTWKPLLFRPVLYFFYTSCICGPRASEILSFAQVHADPMFMWMSMFGPKLFLQGHYSTITVLHILDDGVFDRST